MIKSMTGFGRGEYTDGKRHIFVEIRTVNHRYSDISLRIPRRYSFAEDKIKNMVKQTVRRGKVEVSVIVESITEGDTTIKLNTMVAEQYYANLMELKDKFELLGDVSVSFLATLPDVMKVIPDVEDEAEIEKALLIPLEEACANLDAMRIIEGEKLGEDILERSEIVRDLVSKIQERSPLVVQAYAAKLKDRIDDILAGVAELPEERVLLEAAVFADKCSITEELVRLDSHIIQLNNIISKSNQPDGKKLDFLIQEMNREVNTIGSKANDLEITNMVIGAKSEIEKIREQVQNIE